jgi:hypothetical protein
LPRQQYGYQTGEFERMKQVAAGIKEPPSTKPMAQ